MPWGPGDEREKGHFWGLFLRGSMGGYVILKPEELALFTPVGGGSD